MPKSPMVLVIDDDCSMRTTLSVILEAEGYRVVTAADGDEGLGALRAWPVDVAVVDMVMPGLSGDEVCAAAKAIRPEAAVIMITAHVAANAAGKAVVAGAHSIVYKPLDVDALLASIADLVPRAGGASDPRRVLTTR